MRKTLSINLKDLFDYLMVVKQLALAKKPPINSDAYAAVIDMDMSGLPEHQFHNINGYDIPYRHYTSDSNTHLVLIHGSACFGDQLHLLARHISKENNAQAYTLDMRGHGYAKGPKGHSVEYPTQLADDIISFILSLKSKHPDATIILGGHSAGGGLALSTSTLSDADIISGYLLLAPYINLSSPTLRPHFGGWASLRVIATVRTILCNLWGNSKSNQKTTVNFDIAPNRFDHLYARTWSFNTMYSFGPEQWRKNSKPIPTNKPVLLIAGDKDECFIAERYTKALNKAAPHGETILVPDLGHWGSFTDMKAIKMINRWVISVV